MMLDSNLLRSFISIFAADFDRLILKSCKRSSIEIIGFAPSLMSKFGASDITEVINPGTAYTSFPCSAAYFAVIKDPDLFDPSTAITALEKAEINLFLATKRPFKTVIPGGN